MSPRTGSFVARLLHWPESIPPVRWLVFGYATYILLGALLLWSPLCTDVPGVPLLDHLFTAASAVSTTGLVTVATGETYSFWGEAVVALLIQFGGLGYMTVTSFTVLAVSGDLSTFRHRVAKHTLSLPEGFQIGEFLRMVVLFTVVIETVGAAALYPVFVSHGSAQPVWDSLFHSISAFCTAGFGLYSNSFEGFRDDAALNAIISVLSLLGATGFIVLHDLYKSLTLRRPQVTLTTRIILWSTFWIITAGTFLFGLTEPAVSGLPWHQRWMAALFQVMTASTTVGFNTVPIGSLAGSSIVLLSVAMVIGASPSGTGGGLKTTTVTALWAELQSLLQGRTETTFFGRTVPEPRMRLAVSNAVFYALTLATGVFLLTLCDASPLPDQVFECASALGTVGLSRGITGQLTVPAKLLITSLMFIGRIGPLVLGVALLSPYPPRRALRHPEEDVVV